MVNSWLNLRHWVPEFSVPGSLRPRFLGYTGALRPEVLG